jgi:hypothetical protein
LIKNKKLNFKDMKLKEWNELAENKRIAIAKTVFGLEGDEKVEAMSKVWHHNLDDDHRKLMKAVTVKDDSFVVKVTI